MNKHSLLIKTLLFIPLLTVVLDSYCQEVFRMQMPFDYLYHVPDEEDTKNVIKYGYLKNQQPDSNNYNQYYSLACSLWNLNRIEEARKLFLNIINQHEKYYSTTYYHSSDIPGDTTTHIYGYGSFSSNYKNSVAIYLTKIYIEQKKFNKAFLFLKDAIEKYKTSYSCGTGYKGQQDEYNFLYGCIYEGQKNYDKVMELLLPECLTRDDEIIVRTIKRLYSKEQIKEKLQQAENSIQCKFDSTPSFAYEIRNYSTKAEKTDTLTYYSGTATINLFGKVVTIPNPDLENGERVTKERFLEEFKTSSFNINLTNDNSFFEGLQIVL